MSIEAVQLFPSPDVYTVDQVFLLASPIHTSHNIGAALPRCRRAGVEPQFIFSNVSRCSREEVKSRPAGGTIL